MKVIALVSFLVAGVAASAYEPTVVRVVETPAYGGYNTVRDLPAYGGSSVRTFIPINRFSQEIRGGVSDKTEFESGNGIRVSESTQVVAGRGGSYDDGYGKVVKSDSSLVRSGSYSYTAPNGTPITLSWTADEQGFRATGDHLPTPPPVPADIAAALRTLPALRQPY